MTSTTYWLEHSWPGQGEVDSSVLLEVDNGVISKVTRGVQAPPPGSKVLNGLTIPGLANAHSHAFHRALRGRTEGRGASTTTFWDWRDQMYEVAGSLNPDLLHRLARATFAEMAQAGITLVGEFHYVHHDVDGSEYSNPNAMGEALLAAARDAGVRFTLLDVCYLHGGLGPDGYDEPSPIQRRFADSDADAWTRRVAALKPSETVRVGAAVHSVRAVDPSSVTTVARWADQRAVPLHAHLSEQEAENEQCLAAHGATPTQVLFDSGAVNDRFTAVHGTHLSVIDLATLGGAGATVCLCPTTERDLADGIGQAGAMVAAGAALAVGTDSQSVIDLFEESRAIELDERLRVRQRGHHSPTALLTAATAAGYESLGWGKGGNLDVGSLADLTNLSLDSPRLAGQRVSDLLAGAVFAATASDVQHVMVAGEMIVSDGHHTRVDVAAELREALQ